VISKLNRAHRRYSLLLCFFFTSSASAWDYEGHRIVARIALASLPTNFPAFLQSTQARARIAFLSGEPDRWRNTPDLGLKHVNNPDHYMDIDDLARYGLAPNDLSPFRYEFAAQLAVARAAKAAQFPPIDPAKDADRTKALIGFLPWVISEHYSKLKSAFSYLKTFEEAGGTEEEIRNARENVIYVMGVMAHYVGDGSQPLHMTRNYNGWVDENPHGFTTSKTLHSWIDGGFIARGGLNGDTLLAKTKPAHALAQSTNVFPAVMDYLVEQFELVVPLYQFEKDGKFSPKMPSEEGITFITRQLQKAGQMLGDLWLTAWQTAPPDAFLKSQLTQRKLKKT
jgi:hypothetical protein